MKKVVISILTVLVLSLSVTGMKVFIPKDDGFVLLEKNWENKSIAYVLSYLGYNRDQFYPYFNKNIEDSNIQSLMLKIFTDEIICVIANDNTDSITRKDVENFFVDFNLSKEFDSFRIKFTLDQGIRNKTLSKEFLGEIFNQLITSNKNSFIATEIGFELFFENGVLSDYIEAGKKRTTTPTPQRLLAFEIIEETDGVIEHEINEGYQIYIPSYYDHELFAMKLKTIIRKYDDISVVKPWHKSDDSIDIFLKVSENYMIIGYIQDSRRVVITYEK